MNDPAEKSTTFPVAPIEAKREILALVDAIKATRENSGLKETTRDEVDAWRKDGRR